MQRFFTRRPTTLLSPASLVRSYSAAPFKSQPGPVPLADRNQQKEFEHLVKQFNAKTDEKHPDAPKSDARSDFEGDKNPVTGEVG
ncbi:hypothetical protein HDU98_007724 [Podochytrium sp. JEL0797]|nr:hypothetical protein HDU98_007724 [Podochytrium sp. JEL0797]